MLCTTALPEVVILAVVTLAVGAVVPGSVVKVAFAAVIELPALSSTVEPMDTYTACELGRLLVGLIVMTVLSLLMVASKLMLLPLALVNFSVKRLSMLLSVNSVLSMLRNASLKVMMMLSVIATPVAPLAGLNVTVGAVVSMVNELTSIVTELLALSVTVMVQLL